MNSFLGGLIVELLSGILSSFVFLFFVLFCMRPSIAISDVIVKQVNTFDGQSEHTYMFKIINRSWFDAYDTQLELYEISFYPASPKGVHKRLTEISLKRNYLKQLSACNRLIYGSTFADHCVTFRTNENLSAILEKDHKALLLQVTLRHSISGLPRMYRMNYSGRGCIKTGCFCFGNTFEVK